jgi:hypothetical protein
MKSKRMFPGWAKKLWNENTVEIQGRSAMVVFKPRIAGR